MNPLIKLNGKESEFAAKLILDEHGEPTDIETVFIIGNGAVEGGSDLLNNVMNAIAVEQAHENKITLDDPFVKLSDLKKLSTYSYLHRLNIANSVSALLTGSKEASTYLDSISKVISLRDNFANRFYEGSKKTLSRRVLPKKIEDILARRTTGVVTTNWDDTIWEDEKIYNKIQLHGRAKFPASMIFPTELASDGISFFGFYNALDEVKKRMLHPLVELIGSDSRNELHRHILDSHSLALHWITEAKTLVFWGASLSVYDAEVCLVINLGTGKIKRDRRIICVNKDGDAMETAALLSGENTYEAIVP